MICNYKKEQIKPAISANQIPAILIRLNQALLYKRAVIFCSIQPTHLIEVFSLIKYVYKSHSRWKAIIVSIAMAATNDNIDVATREFRDSSIEMLLRPD